MLRIAFNLFKNYGAEKAIQEALKLNLDDNHLYHALLGQLYLDIDNSKSIKYLSKAKELSKSDSEKDFYR